MKWRELNTGYTGLIDKLRSMDPHELLGVQKNCTVAEIKSAYRKKIRTYHPDRTDPFMRAHGEEVSKLINSAYQLLLENNNVGG